jgi:RimJ/RimL family protein N-acetyltransferase
MTAPALRFRPPLLQDAALLMAWRSTPEVTDNSFTDIDDDLDRQCAWIERSAQRNDFLHRIIQVEGVDVGYVSISTVAPGCLAHWLVGSVGVYMGDKRGRTGIGALNFAPVLNHCFYRLGLRKVLNQIFADNEKVRRGQTMLGYRHVGVLEAHAVKPGQPPRDVHLFEMTAAAWAKARPRFGIDYDLDGQPCPEGAIPP